MELDQLRYFLKIAESGSFTRAAEELGVSQPALSRSIQRLEEELGQPVLERKTRSVALTETGQLMQSRARQVLALIDDTKAEISDDGKTGTIRVGAIPTVAPYLLPGLLKEFSARCPLAHVVVQEDTTDNLLKRCSQGEVDVAILALPIAVRYLDVEELFEEELFLVLPTGHPLANKNKISLTDIETLPFVLLDEAHCLTDNIVSFCRRKHVQPVSVERTSQLATVQELVQLGHGISMVPHMARRIDLSENRVYRSLSGAKPVRKIALVWNPYRFQSRLMKSFFDLCRSYKV